MILAVSYLTIIATRIGPIRLPAEIINSRQTGNIYPSTGFSQSDYKTHPMHPAPWLISTVVQSILIFVTLALPVLLYSLPNAHRRRNATLCALLLLAGYHTLLDLTVDQPLFGSPNLHLAGGALILMYGPLVYHYTRQLLDRPVARWWLHCFPAGLGVAYTLLFGFSHALFFGALLVQYGTYTYVINKTLVQGGEIEPPLRRWLRFVTYGFGLIWLSAIAANALGALGLDAASTYAEQAMFLTGVVYFTSLLYAVLVSPEFFLQPPALPQPATDPGRATELEPAGIERMQELDRLLQQEAIYLDPELDRYALAVQFGISVQQLSTEVNTFFASSLPELINGYRVEAAKVQLLSTSDSVKEIYYAVGFNSRSAFNANFRKRLGVTPSEFRTQAL